MSKESPTDERGRPLKFWGGKADHPAQQEPVAWISESENLLSWDKFYDHMTPLYTSPPAQRKPLTDDEIDEIYGANCGDGGPTAMCERFARAIEAAHNIKGDA